jgi:hypothetical protein
MLKSRPRALTAWESHMREVEHVARHRRPGGGAALASTNSRRGPETPNNPVTEVA